MTRAKTPPRLLAIDPTSNGFAWVLLEGKDILARWGIPRVRPPRNERSLKLITELLDSLRPDVVVIEDVAAGPPRSARVEPLLEAIEETATQRRVLTRRISRRKAYAALGSGVTTKYESAVALARRFPALEKRMPRERKPWMSEDNRMNVFDALVLAVAATLTTRP